MTKDDRGDSLKVRLEGSLDHGKPNNLFLFTMTEEHETGASQVVAAVHRFISHRSRSKPLPPTFSIRVDNCPQENKNRYMFAFLECLLHWRVSHHIGLAFFLLNTHLRILTKESAKPPVIYKVETRIYQPTFMKCCGLHFLLQLKECTWKRSPTGLNLSRWARNWRL